MHPVQRIFAATAIASFSLISCGAATPEPPPVKIAVFDFELDDVSAAASVTGNAPATAPRMQKVSDEARRVLAPSGRYRVVDVSKSEAKPVLDRSLRDCDGCDAGIALQLAGGGDGWASRAASLIRHRVLAVDNGRAEDDK